MHSEFRGLLNADYMDALQNCHEHGSGLIAKKNASNIKELFPVPHNAAAQLLIASQSYRSRGRFSV